MKNESANVRQANRVGTVLQKIFDSLTTDIQQLVDAQLYEIRIGIYSVEFLLVKEINYTLRIKKRFSFELGDGVMRHFIANDVGHGVAESSRFILLCGQVCSAVSLTRQRLDIRFQNGAALWIDCDDNDFEPFEYFGGPINSSKYEFYYVT